MLSSSMTKEMARTVARCCRRQGSLDQEFTSSCEWREGGTSVKNMHQVLVGVDHERSEFKMMLVAFTIDEYLPGISDAEFTSRDVGIWRVGKLFSSAVNLIHISDFPTQLHGH
jgi:hypothetical protein